MKTLITTDEVERTVRWFIPFWAITLLYDIVAAQVAFLPFFPWERLLICLVISMSMLLLLGLGALIYVEVCSVISVLRNW